MINYFKKLNKNHKILVEDTRNSKLYAVYNTEWLNAYWYSNYWYESITEIGGDTGITDLFRQNCKKVGLPIR